VFSESKREGVPPLAERVVDFAQTLASGYINRAEGWLHLETARARGG